MGRVGEQRQRVGDDPGRHLARHEGEDQTERGPEAARVRIGRNRVVMTVVAGTGHQRDYRPMAADWGLEPDGWQKKARDPGQVGRAR